MKSAAALLFSAVAFFASAATASPTPCAALAATLDAAPAGPVFLASYPRETTGALANAAFVYDNAVAAIALAGCNDVPRARRIGDAILIAQDQDRYWHDGRLRNGYAAGAVTTPVKLAGWWDVHQNHWVEDGYQAGSDAGNLAWAMLALLALDRATNDPRYRVGAIRLGAWLERWRDARGPGGFTGGAFGEEPSPIALNWKSTEHNTDLAAAWRALAHTTGDNRWRADAQAAEAMVRALWTPACGCFAVGTGEDGATPNPFLALDAQVFPLLALPHAAPAGAVLATLQKRFGQSGGYAYSEARDGVWTEGTAQAALLLTLLGKAKQAEALNRELETLRAPDGAYYAASTTVLPTGFMLPTDPTKPRQYFHIPALAPLAWAALVERRFNPFAVGR